MKPNFGAIIYENEEKNHNFDPRYRKIGMGPAYNQNPTFSGRRMSIADYETVYNRGRNSLNQTTTTLKPGITQSSAYIKEQVCPDSVFNKTITS